jgi:hypothetical protein
MKGSSWLGLVGAVKAVRDACGVNDGAACTSLIKACTSDVRSRKRPWRADEEPPKPIYDTWGIPISTLVWHGASIDLEHEWLITADDKIVRADIEINADDLLYRLKCQSLVSKKPRTVGKRPRIVALLSQMFQGRVPDPAHYPRKTLRADILKRDPELFPLDDQTLKDSIKEYNATR